MNKEFLDIILAVGALVAALAVAVMCGNGLVVWLADGELGRRPDAKVV